MNKLRDLTAGIVFGTTMYARLYSEMPPVENYQQYNTSIEQCVEYLGGIGIEVAEVPLPCKQFVSIYQPSDGQPYHDANGKPYYYLPSADEFTADFPYRTLSQETALKADERRNVEIKSIFLGSLVFAALRILERVYRNDSTPKTKRKITIPKPGTGWQPNEDAPDYPRAFPNIP